MDMTDVKRLTLAALWLAGAAAPAPAGGQQTPGQLAQFLQEHIGLTAAQIGNMEQGQPVVSVLDTKKKEDVAVFGIITINQSRQAYVERAKDFPRSLRTPSRMALGVFSQPPALADVEAVSIDSQDVAELPRCRVGECRLKLPAVVMDEVRRTVDWGGPNAQAQVDAYARRLLIAYAADYRARGDSALVVYDDRGHRDASKAFAGLLAESPYVFQYVPSLHRYLADYPRTRLEGVTDVLYWSTDTVPSLRPILSVNHLTIYSPPELPGTTLLANKQIFANHYFEALFDLTTAITRPAAPAGGIYLVVIRRFRFDRMPSVAMVSLKGKVEGKLRDQLRQDLEHEKRAAEQPDEQHED
jgi:hypothetical protein